MSTLAPILQSWFTDRLRHQRRVSDHTITAYRDAIRLLLVFAQATTGKPPSQLDLADLDAPLIGAFLTYLETERANSVQTRNARLAAVHALFRHAALLRPDDAAVIQRVLAIPPKRCDRTIVTYLTEPEITALVAAPDPATWTGRRDRALLMLACQTGLRASELLGLRIGDVHLGVGAHVSCIGKGRKHRVTPLTAATAALLAAWLAERAGRPTDPVFPTRRGTPLTRDGLQRRLATHVATATRQAPTQFPDALPGLIGGGGHLGGGVGAHLGTHVDHHSSSVDIEISARTASQVHDDTSAPSPTDTAASYSW
jgi:integrase/recombinase XerD